MSGRRVFSEQEVVEIIKRATELSAEEVHDAYVPGVTLEELERIAKEVGISPQTLRNAIAERGTEPKQKDRFGFNEEFVRVVDGELDPDDFDLAIEGMRPIHGKHGAGTTQIGRSLRSSLWTGISQAHLNIQSRSGRTRIEIKSNPWMQALYTLHPAFMAALITTGAMGERGMGWLGAAIGAGLMVIGTVAFNWLRKAGHRRAEQSADKIKENVESLVEQRLSRPTTVVQQSDSAEQQIDLRN